MCVCYFWRFSHLSFLLALTCQMQLLKTHYATISQLLRSCLKQKKGQHVIRVTVNCCWLQPLLGQLAVHLAACTGSARGAAFTQLAQELRTGRAGPRWSACNCYISSHIMLITLVNFGTQLLKYWRIGIQRPTIPVHHRDSKINFSCKQHL